MKSPEISIIIPVYKAENYLERCLESIKKQTFPDFEVIMVDDGSPDNSGRICDLYALSDSRFKVFHKKNEGVSLTRKFGVSMAIVTYFIHVDPDDWIEENMLNLMYSSAIKNKSDIVICDFIVDTKNGTLYNKQKPISRNSLEVCKQLFTNLHGSLSNKLIKHSLYKKLNIHFSTEFNFCEDLYVNTQFMLNELSISYVPYGLYHYDVYINENSLVRSRKDTLSSDLKMIDAFMCILKDSIYETLAYNKLYYLVIDRAFKTGNYTSKTFKNNFFKYKDTIFCGRRVDLYNLMLYFSVIGFYDVVHPLYSAIKNIKSLCS